MSQPREPWMDVAECESLPDCVVREKRTGRVRFDHDHARCVTGPDTERGHDHYCEIEYESCDDAYCFGDYIATEIEETP